MVKKIISFVLVALMVLCMVPGVAMADGSYVAEIDGVGYTSIKAAVENAKDGDVIKVIKSHNLDCTVITNDALIYVDDKDDSKISAITIDLNGYTVTADYSVSGADSYPAVTSVIYVKNGSKLTMTDSSVSQSGTLHIKTTAATPKVACVFYNSSSDNHNGPEGYSLVIDSGTYTFDYALAGGNGILVYSVNSRTIGITGGTFNLGNVRGGGPEENFSPWIFGTKYQDANRIVVTGGTFNDEINHQYWEYEVEVPREKALKNNGDGTWTVVDAVAYVDEWCKKYGSGSSKVIREIGYATLAEAIAAADTYTDVGDGIKSSDVDKITLLQDCVVNDTLNVSEDLTIDLKGNEIIWKDIGAKPLFDVDAGATLNIPGFNPHVYGNEIPNNTDDDDIIEGGTGGKQFNISRKPGTYTVTWESEGSDLFPKTTQQTYGTPLALPADNPTKASATFIGWFTEEGVQVNEGDPFLSEDTTYYARFRENPAPISSGSSGYSGPDLWYIGGNTFGVTTNQVPTSVEIDNVPVSFTMNGNQITVGCIQPGSDWVTVRWGSVSNQRSFTPDANAYCTQPVIPKTGDVSFWAAIAEFLGF